MAAVTPAAIKELRERTQAGMSDCKGALVEADGDMEKAVEIIMKKGLAKSAKRASAVAMEGEVRAEVSADKRAATIIEVNIQTDFAARSDGFKQFVDDVMKVALNAKAGADLKAEPLNGKTVADAAAELTGKIGEKIDPRRWERVSVADGKSGLAHAYVHLGGKIGVVIAVETSSDDVAKHADVLKFVDDTAMQIAAMNALALKREEIASELVEKQKEIYTAQMREDPKPKPEAAWPKIIEGKVNKWFSEIILGEQESVVVPGKTVDALRAEAGKAAGGTLTITRFVRFERGEGMTKKEDNFADEVAKMAQA